MRRGNVLYIGLEDVLLVESWMETWFWQHYVATIFWTFVNHERV